MGKNIFVSCLFTCILLFNTNFLKIVLSASHQTKNKWFHQAVILNSYQQSYDWISPWEKRGIRTQTGMGLVIKLPILGNDENISKDTTNSNLYLLTTAEMVANSTLIEATIKGTRQRHRAKIILMDYAANLALLIVDDKTFTY